MTDYKTMRVPESAYEAAKDAKQDDETWGEYLQRCSENPPEVREFVERDSSQDMSFEEWFEPDYAQTIARHIVSEIDAETIESGFASSATEQLDEIQRTVEQNNGALGDTVEKALEIGEHGFTDIADQLDTIENSAKTAEERTGSIERQLEGLQ